MKRIFSLLLVLAMLFSMITIVQAEETAEVLTINYWNADSSKIVLGFSHEVDALALQEAATLVGYGAELEVVAAQQELITSDTLATEDVSEATNQRTALEFNDDYIYTISLADGSRFDLGNAYNLILSADLTSADGTAALDGEWSQGFRVNKIYSENFDDYASIDDASWAIMSGTTAPSVFELTDSFANGKAVKIATAGSSAHTVLMPAYNDETKKTYAFADTGFTSSEFWADKSINRMRTEYNVEYDVKMSTQKDLDYDHGTYVYMLNKNYPNPVYGAIGIKTGIGFSKGAKRVYTTAFNNTGYTYNKNSTAETNGTNETTNQSIFKRYGGAKYADSGIEAGTLLTNTEEADDLADADANHISVSVKNNNIKFMIDGNYTNYDFSANNTYVSNGIGLTTFDFTSHGGVTSTYYIDNIYVTYAEPVKFAPISFEGWNADSSKITLEFSAPVDPDMLADMMTLTESGNEVSFSVVEKTQTVNSVGLLKDGPTAYVVIPDDGMKLDTIYTMNIAAGIPALDYTGTMEDDFSLTFGVKKIWKEDFEGYGSGEFTAWGTNSGLSSVTDTTNITLKEVDGDHMLRVTGGKLAIMNFTKNSTQNFADTGMLISSKPYSTLQDYTVELKVDFENDPTSTNTDVRFLMMNGVHTNLGYSEVFMGGVSHRSSTYYTSAAANVPVGSKDNAETASGKTYYQFTSTEYDNKISFSPFAAEGENNITLSAKGQNFKFFCNDEVYNSYSTSLNVHKYGIVGIYAASSTIALIDDIIVTQAIEYQQAEFGATYSDGETDVAISNFVELDFGSAVNDATVTKDTIKVYKNGELFDGYTVSMDETSNAKVVVKFDEDFDYRTEYKITAIGVGYVGDDTNYAYAPVAFTTTVPDFELATFEVIGADVSDLDAGVDYNVVATFANNKIADGLKGVATICLYDENYKMVDIVTKEISIKKGKEDTVTDVWNVATAGKYFAKCYLWDSFESMNTILDKVIE